MVACIDYLCPYCGNNKCETCDGKGSLRLPAGTILTKKPEPPAPGMVDIIHSFHEWFDAFYGLDGLSRETHPHYEPAFTAFTAGWFRGREA